MEGENIETETVQEIPVETVQEPVRVKKLKSPAQQAVFEKAQQKLRERHDKMRLEKEQKQAQEKLQKIEKQNAELVKKKEELVKKLPQPKDDLASLVSNLVRKEMETMMKASVSEVKAPTRQLPEEQPVVKQMSAREANRKMMEAMIRGF
jgi:predicted nuclease with TOPRIM domain